MKEIEMSKFVEMIEAAIENNKYKELLELLPDIEEVKKVMDKAISEVKEYIKYEQINSKTIWDYKIVRNVYMRYKPVDMNMLKEKYPVDKYPDVYNLSLSAKAKDIITDASLIKTVPVETVKITKETKDEEIIDI